MVESKLVNASIIFMGFAILFLALREFQSFLRPFVISIILSFLFVPLTRLSQKKKRTMWISTIGIILGLVLLVSLVSSFLINESPETEIITEEKEIKKSVEEYSSLLNINILGQEINLSKFLDVGKIGEIIAKITSSFLSSLGTFFSEFLLVILFLMFLLPTHDTTIRKISEKLENDTLRKKFLDALSDIEKNIRTYLSIKSSVSFLTAILSGIIMFFFGVKFIILFMLLIFLLNFIPSIGSFLAVIIILSSHLISFGFSVNFLILGVLLILIQILIGNVLEPKISGKQLELSPVFILLSLFFWGSVWGIGGMFFAVPLTSIIRIILKNIDSTKGIVPFIS